jgi:hypothetical protein
MHHLPERDRPPIKTRLRRAWAETDHDRALGQPQRLAAELDHTHPGAAGSLRERMDETLTVIRLGIHGKPKRTLESTNPGEPMIDCVRLTQRNVKHWSPARWGCGRPPPGRSKPSTSSAKRSVTPTYPASPSRSNDDSTLPSPTPPRPKTPPSQPLHNHQPGPPSPKFPDERDNLARTVWVPISGRRKRCSGRPPSRRGCSPSNALLARAALARAPELEQAGSTGPRRRTQRAPLCMTVASHMRATWNHAASSRDGTGCGVSVQSRVVRESMATVIARMSGVSSPAAISTP